MPLCCVLFVMVQSLFIESIMSVEGVCAAQLSGVVRSHPPPVGATRHILHPLRVFKIPADRLANADIKRRFRFPSQLAFNFPCVDRVATIVSGTVLHKRDQIPPRTVTSRRDLVYEVANRLHDLNVRLFVPTADVISLSGLAVPQHGSDRVAVILYVEPVADILSIP